eukprot:scaffold153227_cov33-Attheya_sp.AAC.1
MAQEGVVFSLELHLETLRGGHHGTSHQECHIFGWPGKGGTDLVRLWQDAQVGLVKGVFSLDEFFVNELTGNGQIFVNFFVQHVLAQGFAGGLFCEAQFKGNLQQLISLINVPTRQQSPPRTLVGDFVHRLGGNGHGMRRFSPGRVLLEIDFSLSLQPAQQFR